MLAHDKYLILFPHVSTYVMRSATQAAAQNGHTHGYVSTNFQTLIFNKWDEKLSEKRICIYMFYSIPSDTSCDMPSVQFSFKHC